MEQNTPQNDENNQNNSQEVQINTEETSSQDVKLNKEEVKKLEGEELRQAILSQIEFYFSHENLSSDHFLVSQMDGNKYVPLTVIENFGKVKSLTTDSNLIIDVLLNSNVVELDDTKTKVKSKVLDQQRTTIILRDVLPDSNVEEIEAIFTNFEEKVTKVKFDIGNTCFVSFSSEKAALAALNFVKNQTYRGNPIKALIKNETILRSCNAVKQTANQHYFPHQYQPYQYVPGAWNASLHQENDQEYRSNRDPRSKPHPRIKRKDTPHPSPITRKQNSHSNIHSNNSNNNYNDKKPNRGGQRRKGNPIGSKNSSEFQIGGSSFPPLPTKTLSPDQSESNAVNEGAKTWSFVAKSVPSANAQKNKPATPASPPLVNNSNEGESQSNAISASQ